MEILFGASFCCLVFVASAADTYTTVLQAGETRVPPASFYSPSKNYKFTLAKDRMFVSDLVHSIDTFCSLPLEATVKALSLDNQGSLELSGSTHRKQGVVWESDTASNDTRFSNASLSIVDDGTLQLCIETGCYWKSTEYFGRTCINTTNNASKVILAAGEALLPGDTVTAPSGQYKLTVQTDGNIVIYRECDGMPVFNTFTAPGAISNFTVRHDGNLVANGMVHSLWPTLFAANLGVEMGTDPTLLDQDPVTNHSLVELRLYEDGMLHLCVGDKCVWRSDYAQAL